MLTQDCSKNVLFTMHEVFQQVGCPHWPSHRLSDPEFECKSSDEGSLSR